MIQKSYHCKLKGTKRTRVFFKVPLVVRDQLIHPPCSVEARQHILSLDVPSEKKLIKLRSPVDGYIEQINVDIGELVPPNTDVFTVSHRPRVTSSSDQSTATRSTSKKSSLDHSTPKPSESTSALSEISNRNRYSTLSINGSNQDSSGSASSLSSSNINRETPAAMLDSINQTTKKKKKKRRTIVDNTDVKSSTVIIKPEQSKDKRLLLLMNLEGVLVDFTSVDNPLASSMEDNPSVMRVSQSIDSSSPPRLVKLRPMVREFLESLREHYQVLLYTREPCYPDVLSELDPLKQRISTHLVIYNRSKKKKKNRFGCQNLQRFVPKFQKVAGLNHVSESDIIIVDHSHLMWKDKKDWKNILRIPQFAFWPPCDEDFNTHCDNPNYDDDWDYYHSSKIIQRRYGQDIADNSLLTVSSVLRAVHKRTMLLRNEYDPNYAASQVLSDLKKGVLKGCHISIAGKNDDDHFVAAMCNLCQEYGASLIGDPNNNNDDEQNDDDECRHLCTHLIEINSEEIKEEKQKESSMMEDVKIKKETEEEEGSGMHPLRIKVHLNWLFDSVFHFRRAKEEDYQVIPSSFLNVGMDDESYNNHPRCVPYVCNPPMSVQRIIIQSESSDHIRHQCVLNDLRSKQKKKKILMKREMKKVIFLDNPHLSKSADESMKKKHMNRKRVLSEMIEETKNEDFIRRELSEGEVSDNADDNDDDDDGTESGGYQRSSNMDDSMAIREIIVNNTVEVRKKRRSMMMRDCEEVKKMPLWFQDFYRQKQYELFGLSSVPNLKYISNENKKNRWGAPQPY